MNGEVKKWIIKAENDLKVAKNEIEIKEDIYNYNNKIKVFHI